jgi:hypothetical protein
MRKVPIDGAAMTSNTDSTLLLYSTAHIRVKVYNDWVRGFKNFCSRAV